MKKIVAIVLSLVMVLGLATTAFAVADEFDLYLADADMATDMLDADPDAYGYDDVTIDEVAAKTYADGSGNVAYLVLNKDRGAVYAVKTSAPTVASFAVCEAGKTAVLYYVDIVAGATEATFKYVESVKAFSNWGLKCGQFSNVGFTTEQKADDYFMASDYKVYRAGDAGTGVNYLLNGEVVSGTALGYTTDHSFVANNFKYDAATGANVPTSAICTTCLETTTAIYKIGKAPANSTVKPLSVDGQVSTIWEVVPGAAASAPAAGETVESAKTFDAGIAMYVGMSVMAAAGSAVVLKKKD